jgi:uncharacterized membrane protein YccC
MLKRFGFPEMIFSINSFVAAMLALYIAFYLDLPRPYWALLTVYLVAQPLSGALRSRAVYRLLGTLLAAVVSVALVPNLVNSPLVLSVALAAWVGVCLYISLLDRSPRPSTFQLAGFTAAIISFPTVDAPETIFDTALSRIEEISVAIVCATVIHTISFPQTVLGAINARVAGILKETQAWTCQAWAPDVLSGQRDVNRDADRRRIAAQIAELHLFAAQVPYDTANVRPPAEAVHALCDRLSVLLAASSSAEDRRRAMIAEGGIPQVVRDLLSRARLWVNEPGPNSREEAIALIAAGDAAQPALDARSPWTDYLLGSWLARFGELVGALQDARELAAHIANPAKPLPPTLATRVASGAKREFHSDHGMALLSAAAVFIGIVASCVGWIFTQWPSGAYAPLAVGIGGSLFATLDDPAPVIKVFMNVVILSLPVTALYLFAVLPAIDGFAMLVAVLAPLFLILGAVQANPKTLPIALAFIVGFGNLIAIQQIFTADFATFANSGVALVAGFATALTSTRIFRSVGAGWSARRLLRFGWRDLAADAAAPSADKLRRELWTSRMLDRVGLLVPRLLIAEPRGDLAAANPMRDLRVGLNIIDLQVARRVVGPTAEQSVVKVLRAVSAHFTRMANGRSGPALEAMLLEIDAAIDDVVAAPPSNERQNCLWSLTGLRRNLFPAAPAYVPLVATGQAA